MKLLPLSRERLSQLSSLYPFNEDFDKLIQQSSLSIDLKDALEWLANNDVFLAKDDPKNRYVVGKDMKNTEVGYEYIQYGEGETPIEAIDNAMKVIK